VAVAKSIAAPSAFQPDERQREAIEHLHGPVLVVAGAGTGKTTVLTQRVARLIREGLARPDEILAVTYTENAAREIRSRVQAEVRAADIHKLQAKTFHAYCNELLIRNGRGFGVLDEKDLWIYLRQRLHELRLRYFVRAANVGQFLHDLLGFMSKCHDELVSEEKYAGYVASLERGEVPMPRIGKSKDPLPGEEVLERCREIAHVFSTVERMLREQNLGTFGHMITRAYALLCEDTALREQEQKSARFILVDEFQDANFAQVKVLQTIAVAEQNVFAVGDPDQSVYRFRGASSAAFGLFQRSFPQAKLVVLGKNRRSTGAILNTAYALIQQNPDAVIASGASQVPYKRAPLVSARDEDALRALGRIQNEPVVAVGLSARDLESMDLIETLRERKRAYKAKWGDFAVLYRNHFYCEQLAADLAEREIPFTIDNMNVLDTTEARDLLACAGAVLSSADGASLFRLAALPRWKIDATNLRPLIRALPREAPPTAMFGVLEQVEGGVAAVAAIQQARKQIDLANAHAALGIIVQIFGLDRAAPPVPVILKFARDWENKALTHTKTLGEFLEYLQYFKEAGGAICAPASEEDGVRLMTAHAAKGLEWDHVFIIRASSTSFPLPYKESLVEFPSALLDTDSLAQADGRELCEQEERRLFYVAMTRARKSLTMYAKQGIGKTDKTPTKFLRDLIKDRTLAPWFQYRTAKEFQTDLFGAGEPQFPHARMSAWIDLPPGTDLSRRLSASAVQTYNTCPLQFKLEREWRIPGEVPGAMQYGASIHRVLRTYFDAIRFGREISDEAVLEQFKQDLGQAGIQDPYQFQLYLEQGLRQLGEFLANRRKQPHPEVIHTEEWFDVPLGDVTLTGRVDRMDRTGDGRVVVTDYKTGKPRSQDDADESLQLSIYALAVKAKWGYEVERLVFHNIEEDAAVSTLRSAIQMQEARAEVEKVAQQIADGKFEANPGFYCNFCSYRNLCPATEKRSYYSGGKNSPQKT
jgi:DNA helicase-2/ATP-dependent DNA helicase PcrA